MDQDTEQARTGRPEDERPAGRRRGDRRRRGRDVARVAADLLTVRRAFGEPVREGGATLVPVAAVRGGAGSGWGSGESGPSARGASRAPDGQGSGGGGGFGVRVRPLGVYVVEAGQVTWRPALDLNRVILGGQLVGALAITALAWALHRRRR